MNYLGMALAVAIASTAGCAMHDRVSKAQSEGVGSTPVAGVEYEFRDSDVVALKYANATPLRFRGDATPVDKVFSVLGMPSLKVAPAGSYTANQLHTATAEQTKKYISSVATPAGRTGKDIEAIGLNAIGGNMGAAGMALSLVAGSPKYDPRVNLGFLVCFEHADQTASVTDAVSNCSKKMNAMFASAVTNVTKTINVQNGQFRTGSIETEAGVKTAKVFLGRRGVLASDGYAPADRGGYAARIVAIPINSETTSVMDKVLFLDNGNVSAAEVASALSRSLPEGTAFYLPDQKSGPVGAY